MQHLTLAEGNEWFDNNFMLALLETHITRIAETKFDSFRERQYDVVLTEKLKEQILGPLREEQTTPDLVFAGSSLRPLF